MNVSRRFLEIPTVLWSIMVVLIFGFEVCLFRDLYANKFLGVIYLFLWEFYPYQIIVLCNAIILLLSIMEFLITRYHKQIKFLQIINMQDLHIFLDFVMMDICWLMTALEGSAFFTQCETLLEKCLCFNFHLLDIENSSFYTYYIEFIFVICMCLLKHYKLLSWKLDMFASYLHKLPVSKFWRVGCLVPTLFQKIIRIPIIVWKHDFLSPKKKKINK